MRNLFITQSHWGLCPIKVFCQLAFLVFLLNQTSKVCKLKPLTGEAMITVLDPY